MSKKEKMELDMASMPMVLPLESLKILLEEDKNPMFKTINKKIKENTVRLTLKHKATKTVVKLNIPVEYLEFNKIFYKDPLIPTNHQIAGVLDEKVHSWKVEYIVNNIAKQKALVVVRCKQSNKLIACMVDFQDIEQTKNYIDKCISCKDLQFNVGTINIWRETSCQNEIQTKVNLLKLNPQTQPEKAFCQ